MSRLQELIAKLCPDGVEYRALGEIAEIGTGNSNRNEAIEGGKYPFFVRSATVYRANHYEYDEEAVIVPGEGGVGEIFHCVSGKYALHQRAYRVHLTDGCLINRYLYRYLQAHFKGYILSKAVVATVTSIRKPMFLNFPIAIPPIEIQREVVRILDEHTAAHNELVGQLEEEIRLRTIQQQQAHDEVISRAVSHCPQTLLGEVCQITDGDHQPPPKTINGIPFVTISCINQKRAIDYSQAGSVSSEYYESLDNRRKPLAGDVLMTVVGTLGVPVRIESDDPFVVQRHIAILRPNDTVHQGFLYHFIRWSRFHDNAVAAATGSAQKTIGLRYLRSTSFPILDYEEQSRVSHDLDLLEEAFFSIQDSLLDETSYLDVQLALVRNKLMSFPEKEA